PRPAALLAGTASPRVVALTEGVLQAMRITKMKIIAVLCLSVTLMGGGAGLLAYRVAQDKPTQEKVEPPADKPVRVDEKPADGDVLTALRKKKRDAAATAMAAFEQEFLAGRATFDRALYETSKRLVEAELELAPSKAERIKFLQAHLDRMK